jgi:phosphate-selective porin
MKLRYAYHHPWQFIVANAFCIFTMLAAPLRGAEVSGAQNGRWALASSPYIVTGDIVIPPGRTLTIEPGVVVKFAGYYSFKVDGILRAIGSPVNRIVFTSSRDSEFGDPGTASPTQDDWAGIEFTDLSNDEQSRLENCLIKYCTKPLQFHQTHPKNVEGITISDCSSRVIDINGRLVPFQDGAEQDYNAFFQEVKNGQIASPQPAGNDGGAVAPVNVDFTPAFDLSEMGIESFFEVHGYFDTEFEVDNSSPDGKISDFDVHHANVISTFTFSERAFTLLEIEYEHGTELKSSGGTGLVALERAWLQLKVTDYLNVLVGKFLTPYGIYNLIHDATPTFLSTNLPSSLYGRHKNASGQSDRDYPKFLAGVQINGVIPLKNDAVEYSAYVANGRGSAPFEKDDNTDKAFGFRVRYAEGLERVKIGASFFRGRNGSDAHTLQQLGGADLELNIGNFKLQAEGALNQFDRLDSSKAKIGTRNALGYYAQGSFAVTGRIHPFLRYDRYDPDHKAGSDAETDVAIGLNIGIMKDVFLKFENHFLRGQAGNFNSHELFIASIAAGF